MPNFHLIYARFLKKFLKPTRTLKVVFDCSNGTTGIVLKELFRNKKRKTQIEKLKTVLINDKPEGNFPAHGPNPMAPGALRDIQNAVRVHKADMGAVFDGDGDRVFFIDNRGRMVSADAVAALLSRAYQGPILLDIRSGYLARELIQKQGKKIIDSRVGHYFIKKTMREKKIPFAAELSGHYYFRDFFYADSGIFAAVQMINAVSRMRGTLAEGLDSLPQYYSSGELNFTVTDKKKTVEAILRRYRTRAKRVSRLDGITLYFDDWWFNVRPSNTENVLRLNLEAKQKRVRDARVKELTRLLTGRRK